MAHKKGQILGKLRIQRLTRSIVSSKPKDTTRQQPAICHGSLRTYYLQGSGGADPSPQPDDQKVVHSKLDEQSNCRSGKEREDAKESTLQPEGLALRQQSKTVLVTGICVI